MKILLSAFLLLSLVACSGSRSKNQASETDTGIILADTEEFNEEVEGGDVIADEEFDVEISDKDLSSDLEANSAGSSDQNNVTEADLEISNSSEGTWSVAGNETLMMIAFKIYGDYDRWREIARLNRDQLAGNNNLRKGMTLRYTVPTESFVWNPEGNPYLIQSGDTLGSISQTTYGVKRYWKNIWDNNRPLIKDPNRIFAGFTLYTPVIEREVANQ